MNSEFYWKCYITGGNEIAYYVAGDTKQVMVSLWSVCHALGIDGSDWLRDRIPTTQRAKVLSDFGNQVWVADMGVVMDVLEQRCTGSAKGWVCNSLRELRDKEGAPPQVKENTALIPVAAGKGVKEFYFGDSPIRVIEKDGNPWFVASEVCGALGIVNGRDAVARLDDDERMTVADTDSHSGQRGGAQFYTLINESGLYSIVMTSRKPEAKRFKKWVTSEVLPAIRKTGSYSVPKTREQALAEAVLIANTMIEEQKQQIEYQQEYIEEIEPLAEGYKTFLDHEGTLTFTDCANALGIPGLTVSRLTFFLRDQKYLGKWKRPGGGFKNFPIQKYADLGWFSVKCSSYHLPDGTPGTSYQCRVTPKGQEEIRKIVNKIAEEDPILWEWYLTLTPNRMNVLSGGVA